MPSAAVLDAEVQVFIEETATDSRGNAVTRPSAASIITRCRISPRTTAADKSGAPDSPRWSLIAPITTPLGKWSRVVEVGTGREWSVSSWPRRVAEGHESAHVAAELTELR